MEPDDPEASIDAQPEPESQPLIDEDLPESRDRRRSGSLFGINRQHLVASTIVLLMLFVAAGIGLAIYSSSHQNRIYDGVSVANVELGGKTRSQARALLEPVLNEYLLNSVTLQSDQDEFSIDPVAAGIAFDLDATVERAFAYGRHGNVAARFARWSRALLHGAEIDPVLSTDLTRLDATLQAIGEQVIVPPVNAAIVIAGEAGPAIATEWPGVGFDLTGTRHLVLEQVRSLSNAPVPLVLTVLEPEIARADLETGFATAQVVVSDQFLIRGPDARIWQLDRDDLRSLIRFAPEDGRLSINTEAIDSLVAGLTSAIDRDAVDATVYVSDEEEVLTRNSVDAHRVDQSASADAIVSALRAGSGEASLVVDVVPAAIQSETAVDVAAHIESLIEDGIGINWGDGSERLSRRELLAALTINVDPEAEEPFTIGFDQSVLSSLIEPIVSPLETSMRNARFRMVDDEITVIEDSRVGIAVDLAATIAAVREGALSGADSVEAVITRTEPEYSESQIPNIKFNDQLATGSTSFSTASDARASNIARGAELVNGVMLAPDETFSFLEWIGPIDEANGFAIAFGSIYDSASGATTGPVMGGGLSQVATTIFHAAFWSGLPIVERVANPYWVAAYGQPPSGMVGLDAMVDVSENGSVDFAFENTTGEWIVLDVTTTGDAVTVTLRGTNPGWTVRADEPVVTDRVEADDNDPREIDTPELPDGTSRTVTTAVDGFTVSITRTVSDGDETISNDDFVSTYAASPRTVLKGTGEAASGD